MAKYGHEKGVSDNSEEFPLPADRVALFDIDGTLIDKDYNVTDSRLYPFIQTAQEQGWTIGLSSDTPYEAMALWRKRFGINGPIIAERGALVEHDQNLLYDTDEARAFLEAREQLLQHFDDKGIVVWEGNPVEAIKDNIRIGQPGDSVVLMNNLRQSSLSFFVRRVNEANELVKSADLTELVVADARLFYPAFGDIDEDLNHDYGLVIASRESNNKRRGSQMLRSALQVDSFAMVGNSITDYVGNDIAVHYAVGDSTPAFKERADYIASDPLTSGSVEILGKLALYSRF